ncbi:MAG: glycosyltransferase family 4 protein [Candidatus Binatia bacterium]
MPLHGAKPTFPRIVFIKHRYATHAEHSGYDRIAEKIPGEIIDAGWMRRLTGPVPDRVFSWVKKASGLERYTRQRALLELSAAIPYLLSRRRVFHFLYGDYGYRYLGQLPNPHGHRIVASFHLPASVLAQTIRAPEYLSRLDRVIILGESQRSFFRRYLDDSRISRIPYFVDTDFFTPGDDQRRDKHCLFVGYYLRDLELFRRAVRMLADRDPGVRFTVVARREHAGEFASLPHTEFLTGISDVELRSLYRTATILLLPLIDAVANNSILEALACGLPVVTTEVGSVRDYLDDETGAVAPADDPAALAETAYRLLLDQARVASASAAARRKAVTEFSLPVVAERVLAVLRETAQGA